MAQLATRPSRHVRWYKLKVGVCVKNTNNHNGQLGCIGWITCISKTRAEVVGDGKRYIKLKKNLRRIAGPRMVLLSMNENGHVVNSS